MLHDHGQERRAPQPVKMPTAAAVVVVVDTLLKVLSGFTLGFVARGFVAQRQQGQVSRARDRVCLTLFRG